ncbi:tripartite tricarboxylate transporter substrate binding protein [Cupriavidus sp. D384]|uniref:tripartite tricarboxylate transporter substrate binding protein n=1 Tax=Cupriavidus sp. D384 TaxID=1538095 RepID=UPI0009EE4A3F|nr:tripartite tricarboxylate transporter substrate binding protein [Cupriavidus sp. D384]
MNFKLLLRFAACVILAFSAASTGFAADYPTRPITLIVPYGAGGTTDVFGRALAAVLAKELRQPVIVENKPGVNGTMGAAAMKVARPDGHTLTVVPLGVFRQPYIQKTPYDPVKDLKYVSMVANYNYAIAVNAKSPWKTIKDLIEHTKRNPDTIFYGASVRYSVPEFIMMDLAKKVGLKWTNVPYKGDAEAITSLLGDQVQALSVTNTILPFAQSGRVRILATTGERRYQDFFPEVPTLKEAGYPVTMTSPFGIAGPAGMTDDIVKILDAAIVRSLKDPVLVDTAVRYGIEINYMDHKAYAAYAKEAAVREKDAVKTLIEGAVKE